MINRKNRHFLQSEAWAKFQESLGHESFIRSGDGWHYLALKEKSYGRIGRYFSRLYLPYGPSFDSAEAFESALSDLVKFGRDLGVDYLRIEPHPSKEDLNLDYDKWGLLKQKKTSQPELTAVIDLDQPWEDIFAAISKTNRYDFNKASRRGLSYKISYQVADLKPFLKMMEETAERSGAIFHKRDYFTKLMDSLATNKMAGLAYAVYESEPLVGVLFFDDLEAGVRYYAHAGSLNKVRDLKLNANASLVVYLLQDAQSKGLKAFDFFGVAPVSAPANHRWAGFSRFKRSFGGQDYYFSGTWEKPLKSSKYALLRLLRRFI